MPSKSTLKRIAAEMEALVQDLDKFASMSKRAGYTHYWRCVPGDDGKVFNDKAWAKILASTKKIFTQAVADGIALDDIHLTNDMIRFNGKGDLSHETFVLLKDPDQRHMNFSFCKTNRKPYDKVVTSVLAAAKRASPKTIKLETDGDSSVFKDVYK